MTGERAVDPIRPEEALDIKLDQIPDVVIEVFNDLIPKNITADGVSQVKQKDVVGLLVERGFEEEELFEKHWLDIEDIYREAGWTVNYDKPSRGDTYDAYFTFTSQIKASEG